MPSFSALTALTAKRFAQPQLRTSWSNLITSRRSLSSSSTTDSHPIPILPLSTFKPIEEALPPLTAEEQNQADHEAFYQAKLNIYVLSVVVGGIALVSYLYRKEVDHFKHHRFVQEPYSFFINRNDQVGAGLWPGRHCQFLELGCHAAAYDAADKLLKERAEHGEEHAKEEH